MASKYGKYGSTREYTHPIYDAWRNMKRRCYLKTAKYYKNYGGRGIRVCDEWRDNYADNEQYPAVLPTKGFYNIVNGSSGIATGMACSVPQYNIRELNNALVHLIDNPDFAFMVENKIREQMDMPLLEKNEMAEN